MYFTNWLWLPIALCLTGAVVALAWRWPPLHTRLNITAAGWVLAAFPLAAFLWILAALPTLPAGGLTLSVPWMPTLGLNAALFLDGWSALFGLLVSGIGAVVVVYAGYYFAGDTSAWRFLALILGFMTAMLGLVLAGDVITLFVFWEGTSVISFLLVGYKYKDEAARRGAYKALFITGGGGLALLGGLLLLAQVGGGTEFANLLKNGHAVQANPLYPVILGLIAFGAFTKSAQFPAHIWLPDAMSAPTPASAYLHSATMVKAGIYLMARVNPILGGTDAWFWLLGGFGAVTMLVGAYLGLKQHDLKAVLAYSTVSQLGVLMGLIGQDTEIAFKALVVGTLAHALYKCALFLIAGIVDHETGTRDLQRLGGLGKVMRGSLVVAAIAGLSMAGLPPLFGFLAKETLLATAVHPNLPGFVNIVFPALTVMAGALILAQALMLVYDTFLGQPRDPHLHAHEAPWGMLAMPAIPAVLSVALSLPVEPEPIEAFLASAASAAFGYKVKVSLDLFTGINLPLILSVVAISLGGTLFWQRARLRAWQNRVSEALSFNAVYAAVQTGLDALGWAATRLQTGSLRLYLVVMWVSVGGLLWALNGWPVLPALPPFVVEEMAVLRVFMLLLSVAAAVATLFLQRDVLAILALSASGLGVAAQMALEPSPDVALVQVVVDILATVVLILTLARIPRQLRDKASAYNTYRQPGVWRDALVATGAGLMVAAFAFTALASRPRESAVTPFYEANAKPATSANDIVGAIVVDFRGFDTVIEIAVFGMAGLAVYTLLRYAARKHGDSSPHGETATTDKRAPAQLGISGARTSPFMHLLAEITLPVALMVAAVHMIYGHDQPGDGFTAGVIVSLAVALWYVVLGYGVTKTRLPWLRPAPLIALGISLVLGAATSGVWLSTGFFAPVDYGALLGLPLPKGAYLSSSFLFEVAIGLTVLGSATYLLDSLGRPRTPDAESIDHQHEIEVLTRLGIITTETPKSKKG